MELASKIEKAKKFVEQNTFERKEPIDPTTMTPRCVDGGYTQEQVTAYGGTSFARPGADGGYVEALLAVANDNGIQLSGKEALGMVAKIVNGFGRKFYNHTDTHAEHADHSHSDHCSIGCGHEAKAVEFPSEYGVNATAMQEVIDCIVTQQVPNENVVLDREHTEDAVFVVSGSTKYSVYPWNADKSAMNFVYDSVLDAKVMAKIWAELQQLDSRFSTLDLQKFVDAANLQTGETVKRLATEKGKPTFIVRFDDDGKAEIVAA